MPVFDTKAPRRRRRRHTHIVGRYRIHLPSPAVNRTKQSKPTTHRYIYTHVLIHSPRLSVSVCLSVVLCKERASIHPPTALIQRHPGVQSNHISSNPIQSNPCPTQPPSPVIVCKKRGKKRKCIDSSVNHAVGPRPQFFANMNFCNPIHPVLSLFSLFFFATKQNN
ncbi:uncharacterized protein BKA78DRAFT_39280 [Phyllosticta capitalensis]|uniref:uncharacterized protein n=1 Tax=Phyllosticta capitalensis TaxID=121624 RepID=UPI0031314514